MKIKVSLDDVVDFTVLIKNFNQEGYIVRPIFVDYISPLKIKRATTDEECNRDSRNYDVISRTNDFVCDNKTFRSSR